VGNPKGTARKSEAPTTTADPLNIHSRLYNQIGRLLDDLESADRDELMTMPQRIQSLIAVGRILTIFATLRKNDLDYGNTGSKVREYAAAFASKAHGAGSRAANSRSDAFGLDSSSDEYDS